MGRVNSAALQEWLACRLCCWHSLHAYVALVRRRRLLILQETLRLRLLYWRWVVSSQTLWAAERILLRGSAMPLCRDYLPRSCQTGPTPAPESLAWPNA